MNRHTKISNEIDRALNALLGGRLDPGEQNYCSILAADADFTLHVSSVDAIACCLVSIQMKHPSTTSWDSHATTRYSEQVCASLRYLQEPISPVETDSELATVQMRSNPPAKDEQNRRRYYELVAQPAGVQLVRYFKSPGQPRIRTTMQMTRETLTRVISDLLQPLA